MVLLYIFRWVTRQSATSKKEGAIQFKGKDLHLDLCAKHEKLKRGRKPKTVAKPDRDEDPADFEDSDSEDKHVKASISDILGDLYKSDTSGK